MPENNNNSNDELAVEYSANLIEMLGKKMRGHNKENPKKKISFKQLKEVFINSASSYSYAGYTRGEWACARVNTFLRTLKGEMPTVIQDYETTSLGGFVFEAKIVASQEYDIASDWLPSQEDFTQAQLEMKEHNLNYNFNSIDELYLDDYQPLKFNYK